MLSHLNALWFLKTYLYRLYFWKNTGRLYQNKGFVAHQVQFIINFTPFLMLKSVHYTVTAFFLWPLVVALAPFPSCQRSSCCAFLLSRACSSAHHSDLPVSSNPFSAQQQRAGWATKAYSECMRTSRLNTLGRVPTLCDFLRTRY